MSPAPLPSPGPHRWLQMLGVNRSILLAGGPRLMGMVLGPIGSLIIVFTLTTAEQGMYYVFVSLLGLRTFFELGATACIGQMTPHHLLADGKTPAPEMVAVANRWMSRVALAFGLCVLLGGAAYLAWCGYRDAWTQGLWAAAVIPTAVSGIQEGRLQLLYGAGLVDEVSKVRWIGIIVQYAIQWSLLFAGASLLSFSAAALGVAVVQQWFLTRNHPWTRPRSNPPALAAVAGLQTEMSALVKRAAVVYFAGYFVFQIQQPVLFRLAGPEASARFGFTLMILNSLIGTASLWGMTNFPKFARQVADGDEPGGFSLFRKTWWRTLAVATAAFAAAAGAIELLRWLPRFQDRLLPLAALLPLGAAVWIQTLANAATYWPRAFKQEPFAPTAILQMCLTPPLVWWAIHAWGGDGIGWANLASWIAGGISILWITRRYFPGATAAGRLNPAGP